MQHYRPYQLNILLYAHVSSNPMLTIEILLFFFGLAASSQAVTFGLVADNNTEETIGTAIGFNNMAVISGAILQTLTGIIINSVWQGKMLADPIYTVYEFKYAFAIIPLICLLSIFTSTFLINETNCKNAIS